MSVFKCKMCGGALEIKGNETVAVCEYCGTKQTLPKLDDEKRAQLYDRANYFRRQNEFDKAMGIYEMILSEDKEDSECYWSIVLCRYGIEYVEDQGTHKCIPTVNRAQYTSIFDDKDYNNAIRFADSLQKEIYEAEAKQIDNIQRGILDISSKESPFDVFICYKETDSNGNRTKDSVYAQDIYSALTKEGYKVFFSRITLEDKLGSAYEPYIFAALNSAKVMLVIGTSKENFNAVWVKNEWSRYLSLMKAGKNKTLIPVYKDILPYDMPEEFQFLQSQDIGKVGAVQDIVRGIKKLIEVGQVTETQTTGTTAVIVDTMLKRANEALSRHDWATAARRFENVLDYDNENESAYLGKMLSEFNVDSLEELSKTKTKTKIDSNSSYMYLLENASENLKKELMTVGKRIKDRNKKKKKRATILALSAVMLCVLTIGSYLFYNFYVVPRQIYDNVDLLIREGRYAEARSELYNQRIKLSNYQEQYSYYQQTLNEVSYLCAKAYAENEQYLDAIDILNKYCLVSSNYKDSADLAAEWQYCLLKQKYDVGSYVYVFNNANELLSIDYKDTKEMYQESCYQLGENLLQQKKYTDAIVYFSKAEDYKDATQKIAYAQSKR